MNITIYSQSWGKKKTNRLQDTGYGFMLCLVTLTLNVFVCVIPGCCSWLSLFFPHEANKMADLATLYSLSAGVPI